MEERKQLINYLEQYQVMIKRVRQLEKRLSEYKTTVPSISAVSYDGMPGAKYGVSSTVENTVIRNLSMYESTLSQIHKIKRQMQDIIDIIDLLPEGDERYILEYRYIDGLSMKEIYQAIGRSKTTVCHKCDCAVEKLWGMQDVKSKVIAYYDLNKN